MILCAEEYAGCEECEDVRAAARHVLEKKNAHSITMGKGLILRRGIIFFHYRVVSAWMHGPSSDVASSGQEPLFGNR